MRASKKEVAAAVNNAHIRCSQGMRDLFMARPEVWTEAENDARMLALALILDEAGEKIEKLLPDKEARG